MNDELPEIIRDARLALRRASGIPPTLDEQFEEQRKAELETMETFVHDKLGLREMFALETLVVWTESGVAAKFIVGEETFFLRRVKTDYHLTASEKLGERELLRLSADDPQFGNRVLVAIGDLIDRS